MKKRCLLSMLVVATFIISVLAPANMAKTYAAERKKNEILERLSKPKITVTKTTFEPWTTKIPLKECIKTNSDGNISFKFLSARGVDNPNREIMVGNTDMQLPDTPNEKIITISVQVSATRKFSGLEKNVTFKVKGAKLGTQSVQFTKTTFEGGIHNLDLSKYTKLTKGDGKITYILRSGRASFIDGTYLIILPGDEKKTIKFDIQVSGTRKYKPLKKSVTITIKAVKKSNQELKVTKPTLKGEIVEFNLDDCVKLTKGDGKITYKYVSGPVNILEGSHVMVSPGTGKKVLKFKVMVSETSKYKPLTKTITITIKAVKKSNQELKVTKPTLKGEIVEFNLDDCVKLTKGDGKITYKYVSGPVNILEGSHVMVSPGTGKKVLKFKVMVSETSKYKPLTKTITITIKP